MEIYYNQDIYPNLLNGIFDANKCLRLSQCVKNLGVYLDSNLTFDNHVNKVVSNCYLAIKNIGKIKHLLNREDLERLVHSFVTCKIDYSNVLLYVIS